MGTEGKIDVLFPQMRYDVTMPLQEGRVDIEGVNLVPYQISSMIMNQDTPLKTGDFGLCDLNIGYFLAAVEAGWELVGLPLFIKRKPVYPLIFCRTDRGIETPKDLEGKRIGSSRYTTAITVWVKGLLKERHGVDISTMHWVVSGNDTFPNYDENKQVEIFQPRDPRTGVVDLLTEGSVDAIITDISDAELFERLERNPQIKRLFPDYMTEDYNLYKETGLYTPMHLIVMSKKLNQRHPQLAAKLFTAFEQAKSIAYNDVLSDRGGFSTVYLREKVLEQMDKWGDIFKYGMAANQSTIDRLITFNHEQGSTRRRMSVEELFAESVLNT